MYDHMLALSLLGVVLGIGYFSLRALVTAAWLGVRGTALVWRLAHCRQVCPDCRRLGERCPWCGDDRHRLLVGAVCALLPPVGGTMMLYSPVEFSARAKWGAGLWAAAWIAAALLFL